MITFHKAFANPDFISSKLTDAHDAILEDIKNKRNQKEIKEIEKTLNELVYPEGKIDTEYAKMLKYKSDAYVKLIEDKIAAYNGQETESNKETRKTVEKQTIMNSLRSALRKIKELEKELNNTPDDKDSIELFIKKLKSKTVELFKYYKSTNYAQFSHTHKMRYAGDDSEKVVELVNYLNGFVKIMDTSQKNEISLQEAGFVFEDFLEKTGEAFIKGIAKSEATKNVTAEMKRVGQTPVQRGVGFNTKVKYVYKDSNTLNDDDNSNNKNKIKITKKNMILEYNPGATKDAKVDVQFNFSFSGDENQFRFSAKRWTRGYGNFGHTSIDAGITRAAGINVAEAYKYAVLRKSVIENEYSQDLANKAHDFAKIALASDIIMGLNQGDAGYANLLVVDTGKKIVVRDIPTIINEIEQTYKEKGRKIKGYKESDIEEKAWKIYDSMRGKNMGKQRSVYYLLQMTSALSQMKVTINYSVKNS